MLPKPTICVLKIGKHKTLRRKFTPMWSYLLVLSFQLYNSLFSAIGTIMAMGINSRPAKVDPGPKIGLHVFCNSSRLHHLSGIARVELDL